MKMAKQKIMMEWVTIKNKILTRSPKNTETKLILLVTSIVRGWIWQSIFTN